MTNHEKMSSLIDCKDPIDVTAVKMLLARIWDDYERELFESNYGQYLHLYKGMKDWLNSEAKE